MSDAIKACTVCGETTTARNGICNRTPQCKAARKDEAARARIGRRFSNAVSRAISAGKELAAAEAELLAWHDGAKERHGSVLTLVPPQIDGDADGD